jgi:lysophospholipase L1-like esterase
MIQNRFTASILFAILVFIAEQAIAQSSSSYSYVLKWKLAGNINDAVLITASENKLFVLTHDDEIWFSETGTGRFQWHYFGPAKKKVSSITASGDQIFIATKDNIIWRSNEGSNPIEWQYLGPANDVTALAAAGKHLYLVANDHRIWISDITPDRFQCRYFYKVNDLLSLCRNGEKLLAVTRDNRILSAEIYSEGMKWHFAYLSNKDLKQAISLTCSQGRLYAVMKNNQVWMASLPQTERTEKVAIIGDSLSFNIPPYLNYYGFDVDNLAAPSMTANLFFRKMEKSGAPAVDKAFIMLGINDVIGDKSTNARIIEYHVKIIHLLRQKTPKSKIYVQSILPVTDALQHPILSKGDVAAINKRIESLNEDLHMLCKKEGAIFISLYNSFLDKKTRKLKMNLTFDGVHLTEEAYTLWSKLLLPYMK